MATQDEIVARARACVGARFRPHGRDPRWGLDCVGVAGIAFGQHVAGDYPLRGGSVDAIRTLIDRKGLTAIPVEHARSGDLALIRAGHTQLHLAVLTDGGFVHADAALRRVVETPGRPGATLIGAWREES
jgi:murein DD-endopeptidase / murein LD-carboxypeptidase